MYARNLLESRALWLHSLFYCYSLYHSHHFNLSLFVILITGIFVVFVFNEEYCFDIPRHHQERKGLKMPIISTSIFLSSYVEVFVDSLAVMEATTGCPIYCCNGTQYTNHCTVHAYGESGAKPMSPLWACEMENFNDSKISDIWISLYWYSSLWRHQMETFSALLCG